MNIIDVIDDIAEQTNQLAPMLPSRLGPENKAKALQLLPERLEIWRPVPPQQPSPLRTYWEPFKKRRNMLQPFEENESVSIPTRIRDVDQSYRESIILGTPLPA